MSKQKAREPLVHEASARIGAGASSNRPGPEEPYQETVAKSLVQKEEKRRPLTAEEAIGKVLARKDRPSYHHAGHTEVDAIELLVKAGWDREEATSAVGAILYSGPGSVG